MDRIQTYLRIECRAWSMNYEEFDNGVVNYPVAIIELSDGSIVLPYAADVVFLDK